MAIDGSAIADMSLTIAIILLSLLIFGGFAWLGLWAWMKKKRFDEFDVVIWTKDGFGQIVQKVDKAGVFLDRKTMNKRFYLKFANVGLDPDNVPYIVQNGRKKVYLQQVGLKNFKFIKPNYTDDEIKFEVGEEDVNWASNSYERQKKIFGDNKLLQYLPFIILAFVCLVILILFIYFFKQFPVLKETALAFKEAAVALAQAQAHNATMILQ